MGFWGGKVRYLRKGIIIPPTSLAWLTVNTCLPRDGLPFPRGGPLALSLTRPTGMLGLYPGQRVYPLGQKERIFALLALHAAVTFGLE